MKKNLNTPLSLEKLFEGITAAIDVAELLFAEAKTLYSNGYYSGALTKCVLSLEEFGKHKILFYQSIFITNKYINKKLINWKKFWKNYYNHVTKLQTALEWLTFNSGIAPKTKDELKKISDVILNKAREYDNLKQSSQYSDYIEDYFNKPLNDVNCKNNYLTLHGLIKYLLNVARIYYPKNIIFEDFSKHIHEKIKFMNAIHFLDDDQITFQSILHLNTEDVCSINGYIPSKHNFINRVKEKYSLPFIQIPKTLDLLNKSQKFKDFYLFLKDKYGYPDWIIVSVIINIVFNYILNSNNSPISADEFIKSEFKFPLDTAFSEDLPIEEFTNENKFEYTLDLWLGSFLTGLGIILPPNIDVFNYQIRRTASCLYDVFKFDIKHKSIFHF